MLRSQCLVSVASFLYANDINDLAFRTVSDSDDAQNCRFLFSTSHFDFMSSHMQCPL